MWLEDYPPDIQRVFGPMSDEARRRRFQLGIPVILGAVAIVILATLHLVRGVPETAAFLPLAIHTFALLMSFNLVDLLLIDWLLFVRIQPDWVVLPGTGGLAGYSSYGWHARAFFKGTLGIAVVSLGAGLLGHLA